MFEFNEDEYRELCKKALLNEELAELFLRKIKGESVTKIAYEMHMSERTIIRKTKILRNKIIKCL